MIAEKLEGFGETVLELIGVEKIRTVNPVVFETNFLKERSYTPTSNLQGDIYDAITQYKYLIVVHEDLDPTAENYIRLDTYNQSNQRASRLRGKYYTTSNGSNPQLQPLANFEDINGKISANIISNKGFVIAVFDMTRENNFNYIKYQLTWINGFPGAIAPKLTFFGTNDESYNFFKSDNTDNAELVKVDGLQNLGTEATLQAVLAACQNIKISADSVNLNVDTVEAKLEDIKTNQTNKTQFAKITDGVDDLVINEDGSINIREDAFIELFNQNLNSFASPPIPFFIPTGQFGVPAGYKYVIYECSLIFGSPIVEIGLMYKPNSPFTNWGYIRGYELEFNGVNSAFTTEIISSFDTVTYTAGAGNLSRFYLFDVSALPANIGFSPRILNIIGGNQLKLKAIATKRDLSNIIERWHLKNQFSSVNNNLLVNNNVLNNLLLTTNPTDKYMVARTDSVNAIKYFGFVDKDGNYYIMKQDSTLPVETFTYAIGINFITDWANRASLVYQEFNDVF